MRLVRRLLPRSQGVHMTDDEILAETGIPSPSDLLRLARVRYLSTLFACHMVVPWGLLQADFPWMELIKHDVSWMWTQLKGGFLFARSMCPLCSVEVSSPLSSPFLERIGQKSWGTCRPAKVQLLCGAAVASTNLGDPG